MKLTVTFSPAQPTADSPLADLRLPRDWSHLPVITTKALLNRGMKSVFAIVPVVEAHGLVILDYQAGPMWLKLSESYLLQLLAEKSAALQPIYAKAAGELAAQFRQVHHTKQVPHVVVIGSAVLVGCRGNCRQPNVVINGRYYDDVRFTDAAPMRMTVILKAMGLTCTMVCDYADEAPLDQLRVRLRFVYAKQMQRQLAPLIRRHLGIVVDHASRARRVNESGLAQLQNRPPADRDARRKSYFRKHLNETNVPPKFRERLIKFFDKTLDQK